MCACAHHSHRCGRAPRRCETEAEKVIQRYKDAARYHDHAEKAAETLAAASVVVSTAADSYHIAFEYDCLRAGPNPNLKHPPNPEATFQPRPSTLYYSTGTPSPAPFPYVHRYFEGNQTALSKQHAQSKSLVDGHAYGGKGEFSDLHQ